MAKKKEDKENFGVVATPRVSMGSDLLDLLVGGDKGVYGLPFGAIIQLYGDSSTGKAAPLTSHVLTPTGWKQMGDISIGDIVVTPYRGEHAKVLGVYPQGMRDIFRFRFNDNSFVDSADNHYWVVQTANQYNVCRSTAFGNGSSHYLLSTKEIANIYKSGNISKQNKLALPLIEPVEFAVKEKPKIPAYIMGLLLADGCLTNSTPIITNSESDIISKVIDLAKTVGLELHKKETQDGADAYSLVQIDTTTRSWVPDYIKQLGLNCKSTEKHIPKEYLYGSITDRIELLHGIFDGDGYVSKMGNFEIYTTSPQLVKDIAELVRSLGMKASIYIKNNVSYLKDGKHIQCKDCGIISIYPNNGIMPCSSNKHTSRIRKTGKPYNKARRIITSIEYIGKQKCQCIYIDHPKHLYLMDNYVPTHNTFIKNEIIAATYWALKKLNIPFVWESDDCETGDTFDTTRMYGFDIHPSERRIGSKVVHDAETIEEMDAKLSLMIQTIPADAYGIYAVDSLDGLADATKKKKEAERLKKLESGDEVVDAGDYGAQIAKFLSQDFFRNKHRPLEKAHILLVIVSQTRTNMGAGNYAPKRKTSNGDAMEFYCHTRVQLKRVSDIVKNGKKVGVYVKATTTKSKTPRPYREVFYSAYFDYGIDNIGSNLDYLFDLRTADEGKLKKSAEAIAWSENAKPKTLDNLKQWLNDNNYMDECKADKKASTNGSSALSVGWVLDWVADKKDPAMMDSFNNYFGEEYSRDELIKLCEDNPEMNAELTRRVREKWEALEDAVATKRPSKYGT